MAWLRPALAAALAVTREELADLLGLDVARTKTGPVTRPAEVRVPLFNSDGGSVDSAPVPAGRELVAVVGQVRQAMHEASFTALSGEDAVPVPSLDRQVTALWRDWHLSDGQRSAVGPLLPNLIRAGHRAVQADDNAERRRAQALLGDVYRLVQRFLAHIAEPELHALAVERGRSYSEVADRPYSLALAAWSSAISMSALGHFDEAGRVSAVGAHLLEPALESNAADVLGAYGALHLEAAAAHGFAGRVELADRHLAAAATAAQRLPAGYWHLPSGFERTSVTILQVILQVARGATSAAVDLGEVIIPDDIPSRVRRSRLLLELGLAHSRRQDPYAAVFYLQKAASVSREAVALIPWAVDLADELAVSAPPALKPEAEELATALLRQVPA